MSQIYKIKQELAQLRAQQSTQKRELKRFQRRYDKFFGGAFFGVEGVWKLSKKMYDARHNTPLEIRAREIALEFLTEGRFDRVERKFYYLSEWIDRRYVVLLDSGLAPEELDRAGHLWGKHGLQWQAIRQAMMIVDFKDPDYINYGWRWSLSEYQNSDNAFLRWIYRTHSNCACVDFKKSSTAKTYRKTEYYLLYV